MKKKLIRTLAAGAALAGAVYAANKSIKAWKSASEHSVGSDPSPKLWQSPGAFLWEEGWLA